MNRNESKIDTLAEPVRRLHKAVDAMLDADRRPAPASYRRHQPLETGPLEVDTFVYTSREFHDLEMERLWKRVWQMACHEDDLPNVGDYLPYDIGGMSFLLVRSAPDEFKAYYNACLHRNRKLRDRPGKGTKEFKCQFHGWTWNLEGKLTHTPCLWDFPELKREDNALPQAKVGRWGGFIFINPDPAAEPLHEYLGDLSSHFERVPYEKMYKRVHVAKLVRCNWKIAQESFMESYHVIATHVGGFKGVPSTLRGKYDIFGNYNRAIDLPTLIEPGKDWGTLPADGTPRSRDPLTGYVYEAQEGGRVKVTTPNGNAGIYTSRGEHIDGELGDVSNPLCDWVNGPQLENVGRIDSERTFDERREQYRVDLPSVWDKISDIELASSYFSVFPNFHPWGSFNQIVYRFRPNGDNHEECIMEVILMAPRPEGSTSPPAPAVHWLGIDDDWTKAPQLGMLAKIFNQDSLNMQFVHEGMKAAKNKRVQFAQYNESKIRHFHELLSKWVES